MKFAKKAVLAAAAVSLGFMVASPAKADVVPPTNKPVPEPLTILGTGAAVGFGALFRKMKKDQ
ncbi:MAG: PEP-CTERM sorting domain-containing protein [Cyanobacteria bacterium]|nr:PEP-CTERM sorting domain-containing protein [Cyanobacteriota bacterium]